MSFYQQLHSGSVSARSVQAFKIGSRNPKGVGCNLHDLVPLEEDDGKKIKVCFHDFTFNYVGPSPEGLFYKLTVTGNIDGNSDNSGT